MNESMKSLSPRNPTHCDHSLLTRIEADIVRRLDGPDRLAAVLGALLRDAIDEVIDTTRTRRLRLEEVEKTEKTYLGTKVEILVRARLDAPKGEVLDLQLVGEEVDIKNTMGGAWMIPNEAIGRPCLVLRESEKQARFWCGLVVARHEYLRAASNQDRKRSLSPGSPNILWICESEPYPRNFWRDVPPMVAEKILTPRGGTTRLYRLFRAFDRQCISRSVVESVSRQRDYMKRLRKNGGARDLLAQEDTLLLSGHKPQHRKLAAELGIGTLAKDAFVAVHCKDATERDALLAVGGF